MIKSRKALLAAALLMVALLAVGPLSAQEELKIGFVNTAKLLDNAPQLEEANRRLKEEFAPRERELMESQRQLRALEEELSGSDDLLQDVRRRGLEREILQLRRDLKRDQEELREDYNIRGNEELRKLQRLVLETIGELAREEGFDLVINEGAVAYFSEQVDITDRVLERLTR
ncbi:MAG: OmpH family outer membrane protein [Candidatus Competibacteraceae bacterium]|nr:OmpH family outer membrane protein [Candidatus Competibacteraceae bacterium]